MKISADDVAIGQDFLRVTRGIQLSECETREAIEAAYREYVEQLVFGTLLPEQRHKIYKMMALRVEQAQEA